MTKSKGAMSTGRFPKGRDPVVLVRMPQALIAAIDRLVRPQDCGRFALSRSDTIRKLVVKALGRAGQRAMKVAAEERFARVSIAYDARYPTQAALIAEFRKRLKRKRKRLSPVCLNSPRLAPRNKVHAV